VNAARGGLALCAFCLLLLAAAPGPARAGSFVGDWARSPSQREADGAALEAEIERATASISVWTRGLARAFMRRHVAPTERYRISEAEGALWIHDLDTDTRWRVDGAPEPRESGAVTSRLEAPGRIRQEWSHGDSHGVTVWTLAPSGDALAIAITVHHVRLPEPLHYRTHYERVAPRQAPR